MKYHALVTALILIILPHLIRAQINSLPSEYDKNISDVCLKAQNNWAIDYNVTERNLADIYQALNFSKYKIEVVSCNELYSSAMAYLDRFNNKRYILINENKATDLNTHYFSHLFIIAHEFSHHLLNHFTSDVSPTLANKRLMELQADKNGASLVKMLGGTIADCKYALDQLNHPVGDDTYYDHPTKEKRYEAVERGFANDNIAPIEPVYSFYTNFFKDFNNISLLKYPGQLTSYDVTYYFSKTKMYPATIAYFNNSYWIYWKKQTGVSNFHIWWNYDQIPADIQKYFDDGYNIEFLEKINGKWFLVMLKYDKSFGQRTRRILKTDFYNKSGEFHDKVESFLSNGYAIQNLIDDGIYFEILFTPISNDYYSWATRPNYPDFETWYKAQMALGYNYMYCYKHVDYNYFGFMVHKANIDTWTTSSFNGLDASDLINKLNNGFAIDNITVDDTYMHVIFCKYR